MAVEIRGCLISRRHPRAARSCFGAESWSRYPEPWEAELAEKHFSRRGVFIGLILILFGCALGYVGLLGEFPLLSELSGIYADEIDALPGLVLIVFGLIVIWGTRYKAE